MQNQYAGKCGRCGMTVVAGAGTVEKRNGQWIVFHTECPEITSGLGIGGAGSDDYNIHTERDAWPPQYIHGQAPRGARVCPAGTTEGQSDPGGRCEYCGQPADWNPGAGMNLCRRHWDEY